MCVCLLRVLSFHFGCFWIPSFFVPRLLWLLVWPPLPIFLGVYCVRLLSGVLRRTFPSFVFMCEDILSAFEILSLKSPSLSLSGLEVCLVLFLFFVSVGSWAFCLRSFVWRLGFFLGSGKFHSPVFVCDRSLLRSFSLVFYPLRVVGTKLWSFFFSNKSSDGPQVVFFLRLGSGAAAPCVFRVWACGICLCVGSWGKTLFCLSLLRLQFAVFLAFSKTVAACGDFLVVPMLLFYAAFFFFHCECLLGTWWYALFWSLACFSFAFCGALAPFGYRCLSSLLVPFLACSQ